MPATSLLNIPPQEQNQMLAALRHARYGDLLALHILLRCAADRTPTAIAAVLFCSHSSVYRLSASIARANWALPSLQTANSLPPYGHGLAARGAALVERVAHGSASGLWLVSYALELCDLGCATDRKTRAGGLRVERAAVAPGDDWVWKRAKLVAKNDDPQRVERLALIRWHAAQLQAHERMVFAAEALTRGDRRCRAAPPQKAQGGQ